MNVRTIILVCVGGVALLAIACAGLGFLVVRSLTPPQLRMPPELGQPSVVAGEGLLQQRVLLEDASLGPVTDILFVDAPEPAIAIAGLERALWVTPDGGETSSVSIGSSASHLDFLDVEGDGSFEFLNRGGSGWDTASLIDASGQVLWTCHSGSGVDDMAAGDLDGDGVAEFVVGYNGGGGVHLLDRNGRVQWQQVDANVWHVEVVDTDGDGSPEIVHSNAGGQITVRDATGRVVLEAHPGPYFSDFSLCRWPTNEDPQRLLLAEDDQIWLFDFDGTTVAQFDAPHAGSLGEARGSLVKFGAEQPPYLAVVVEFDNWDRSVLYLYDDDGALVYQEIIGEACASLAAVPRDGAGAEVLLIGGAGKVWEYSRSP